MSGNWLTHAHTGTVTTATIANLTAATSYQVQVLAVNSDGDGPFSSPGAGTTGTATNAAPTVANAILNQTATVGTALNYAFPADTFNDADSDTLTYTATQSDNSALPAWLSFAAATRTFSGTPQAADVGTVSVKVTASDGTASVSAPFDIVVSAAANNAPVFATDTTSRSFTETVGDAAVSTAGDVGAVVTATDADSDTLTYSLEGTDVAKFGIISGSGQIQTKVGEKYNREAKAIYSVTVKADDSNGGSDTIAVTINVDNAEEKPVAPAIPTVTATSGSTTSLDVSWMAPGNTGRPAITGYKVEYRPGVSGNWLTHAHTGTVTTATIANLTAATSYQVQVLAVNSDGDGPFSSPGAGTTGTATNSPPTVANAILNQTATVGTALNYAFPADTFADTDAGDTLTYTATQSDDSALPAWLSFAAATRTFSGTPLTADVGTVSVKVTASDGNGGSVSDTFDIVVSAAANTAPVFATDTASRSFFESEGDELVLSQENVGAVVTATDADGDTLIYTLEGTDAAKFGIISGSGQIQTKVGAKYNREAKASYSVTVKADDDNGGSDTIAVTINVDNAEEKPLAPAIPTVTATSGSTTSLDVSWMAPANTGRPAITGYKVEYRAGASGNWLTHAHTGTGTTATIANLTAATSYQVQVLAVNSDGDGPFSSPGAGTTGTLTNTLPTAANNTVTTAEQMPYTFEADDFGFVDTDTGDTLASVKIVTLPAVGTLALDGAAVTLNQVVTKAQIDDDDLTFTPVTGASGTDYANFTFKVNDGTGDSDSAYTMTIDVTDTPALTTCAAPDLAGRNQIWTGELTVANIEIGGVSFGYGLGFSHGSILPSEDFSIGSRTYTIDLMREDPGANDFSFSLTSDLTEADRAVLRLHVCDLPYDFSGSRSYDSLLHTFTWGADNLDWDTVTTRTLYLSLPDDYVVPVPPGAPTGLSAQSVSGKPGYLRLSWTPASGSASQLDHTTDYEARYRKTGTTNWSPMWSFRSYGTPGFDYPPTTHAVPRGGADAPLIYYLDPNTEYQVQVRAINAIGESGWSNRASATTAQATTANDDGTAAADNGSGPATAPSQPTVRRVANEPGLMVRWNAPRTVSSDTPVAYEVEIEKERERDRRITTLNKRYLYVVKSVDDGTTPPPTYLLIPALEPNTTYTVRVRVVYQIPVLEEGLTTVEGIYSAWSPDTSGTTATGRAHNIQLSLEFPDGTRSTTAAPGDSVTYRVKATGIHDWAAVRARGGIGKANIRIWEPERHKYHYVPYSYYQSTKGITYRHFINQTGSSGYLEGAFTVPDEAGAGASGTIEIHLIPPPSPSKRTSGSTIGSVNTSTNKLCIAVDRSGTIAHPCSSGQTQAVAPTVEGTPGLSASGSDGSWAPGQTVEAIVTFSEAVTVGTSSGTPSITLTLGGTVEQSASYTRGSGTKALVFVYTLSESDGSHTAMGVTPDSLALNGGSITSEASGADADLGHNGALIMGERDGGTGPRSTRAVGGVPPLTGPTASFSDLPATHDGEKPFTVKLSFSAKPRGLSYKTVRDSLLEVTGGTVTGASRVTGGSDREWKVTVKPSQGYDITLTLPARACSETAAVCIDGRSLARAASATIPGKALTAALSGPAEHDGSKSFTVRLTFSMEPDMSYKTVRDTLFIVTGGAITGARRVNPPHNREFDIVVKPGGDGAVSLSLASSQPACGETGAVCTAPGRKIEGTASVTVLGPVAISVADARVQEGSGAKLSFAVTLDRARSEPVAVDYATSNGEAQAGVDYVAASGTLNFSANETSKMIEVDVLADEVDEDSETLTLTLTNPVGARIADGTATGTIENTGDIPKAWIGRFGRTVADQVLDAVDVRLRAARTSEVSIRLAGQQIGGAESAGTPAGEAGLETKPTSLGVAAADSEETAQLRALSGWLSGETGEDSRSSGWSRTLTGQQALMGSSFSLAAQTDGGGFAALWGRMAQTRFAGREDTLSLDGDVTTGLFGADYASGRWTTGLVVSHSIGEGGYRGESSGEIEASVTALTPWAGYAVTERLSVWGAAGYGAGELELTRVGEAALKTDLGMKLAAAGARATLIDGEGPKLDAVTDARWVRTTTAKVSSAASDGGKLASASASVMRLRLGLEGSWPLALGEGGLGEGATVTPRLAVGVRHDGGDAETGFGADIGAGVALAWPAHGLTVSLEGRGVLTHEASGLRDRGLAGSLAWSPLPSGRGPQLMVSQTIGASASGGKDALLSRTTLEGLAGNDNDSGRQSLQARFGYGFAAFGGGFTMTPEIGLGLSDAGRDYDLGWRLTRTRSGTGSLELSINARRRESANDDVAPEHSIGFTLTARF